MLSHRVQLHEELKRKATSPDGDGIPAVLKTSSVVKDVDPETATVTLEDGSSFSGDLVLGADGVSVRYSTNPEPIPPHLQDHMLTRIPTYLPSTVCYTENRCGP